MRESHFGYHIFIELFHCILSTYYLCRSLLIFILVFCFYVCVNWLEDKRRVKFGDVKSSLYSFYSHILVSIL